MTDNCYFEWAIAFNQRGPSNMIVPVVMETFDWEQPPAQPLAPPPLQLRTATLASSDGDSQPSQPRLLQCSFATEEAMAAMKFRDVVDVAGWAACKLIDDDTDVVDAWLPEWQAGLDAASACLVVFSAAYCAKLQQPGVGGSCRMEAQAIFERLERYAHLNPSFSPLLPHYLLCPSLLSPPNLFSSSLACYRRDATFRLFSLDRSVGQGPNDLRVYLAQDVAALPDGIGKDEWLSFVRALDVPIGTAEPHAHSHTPAPAPPQAEPAPPPPPPAQYVHFAVQPSALVTGHVADRVAFLTQMRELHASLAKATDLLDQGRHDLCLSDASAPELAATVRASHVHVLVWCADGHGWELPSTPPATLFEEVLLAVRQAARKPAMAILCLRYGARLAAEQLHAAGVPLVLWMKIHPRGTHLQELPLERLFLHAIAPTVEDAHTKGYTAAELQTVARRRAEGAFGDAASTSVGCIAQDSSTPIALAWWRKREERPPPERQLDWVTNICAPLLKASQTNLAMGELRDRLLRESPMLACDVSSVSQARELLSSRKRVAITTALLDSTSKERTSGRTIAPTELQQAAARCRAVAMDACSVHVQATGRFALVYYVATPTQLAGVQPKLAACRHALVWFDLRESGLSAEAVSGCLKTHNDLHVLLTSDAASEEAYDAVMEEGTWREVRLDTDADLGAHADVLHQELRLTAKIAEAPCALLSVFGAEALVAALREALPGNDRPLAAVYCDDDDGALIVRTHVSDVALLHEQRDEMLAGRFEMRLSSILQGQPRRPGSAAGVLMIEIDRTQFAQQYEQSVLALEKLTPHQQAKLAECAGQQRVHVKAPAGAGKTYLAMHEMLGTLEASGSTHLLFIARNQALCLFVLRWLCARPSTNKKRRKMLSRLHVLFEPLEDGPRACALEGQRIEMYPDAPSVAYAMVVVDEAHHMYRYPSARSLINEVVDHSSSSAYRLMLLSDISQSTGRVRWQSRSFDLRPTPPAVCHSPQSVSRFRRTLHSRLICMRSS